MNGKYTISRLQLYRIILLLIILISITANIVWILRDTSPALWDIAGHSQRSASIAQLLHAGRLRDVFGFDSIYPPLTYLVTAVGFLLFGLHSDIPQYSFLLWLVLMLVATYSIANTLYRDRGVALFSTTLLLCYPLLAHFTRIYDLDFPLTALVTATIAALLRTNGFRNRRWVVVTSVCIALTLLTKWTAVLFLAIPVVSVVCTTFVQQKSKRRVLVQHIALALGIILFIAGPWYLVHGSTVVSSAQDTRNNIFSVPYENVLRIDNITYYARQSANGMAWPLSVLVVIGFIALFFRKHSQRFALLAWVIVPYLIMTFALYSKESRYFLPLFPLFAIVSGAGIVSLKNYYRVGAITTCLILSLFFWTETSWSVRFFPEKFYQTTHLNQGYGYPVPTTTKPRYGFTQPTQYHENLAEVVTAIQADLATQETLPATIRIAVVPNSIFLTAQEIQYIARLQNLDSPSNQYTLDFSLSSYIRQGSTISWQENLAAADYIITKTGDQGPKIWGPNLKKIATAEEQHATPFEQFTVIGTWTLHGIEETDTTMRLYKKTPTQLTDRE
ncbi:MAG: glycosyltransferase family 39 protein [Candidatus Kerfeldbacteria bacterium]|nr:glycosyltransferase family 39 protein [Candidatus Kerfeldbacteria bacterium]